MQDSICRKNPIDQTACFIFRQQVRIEIRPDPVSIAQLFQPLLLRPGGGPFLFDPADQGEGREILFPVKLLAQPAVEEVGGAGVREGPVIAQRDFVVGAEIGQPSARQLGEEFPGQLQRIDGAAFQFETGVCRRPL